MIIIIKFASLKSKCRWLCVRLSVVQYYGMYRRGPLAFVLCLCEMLCMRRYASVSSRGARNDTMSFFNLRLKVTIAFYLQFYTCLIPANSVIELTFLLILWLNWQTILTANLDHLNMWLYGTTVVDFELDWKTHIITLLSQDLPEKNKERLSHHPYFVIKWNKF